MAKGEEEAIFLCHIRKSILRVQKKFLTSLSVTLSYKVHNIYSLAISFKNLGTFELQNTDVVIWAKRNVSN